MKKFIVLFLILFSNFIFSQNVGGRLKEVQNQRKLRRTIFHSGWTERKWQPNHLKHIEPERKLFFRHRTTNAKKKELIQRRINKKRERWRLRQRNKFHKRKYHRF